MFDKLRKYQQQRVLRILTEPLRIKRIENISDIGEIGLIISLGAEKDWNLIMSYTKRWEAQGKCVRLIGILPAKTELNYIISAKSITICHVKNDLDFFKIPKDGILDEFIKHQYDLIIDITTQPNFLAQYTAAKTLANLKVTYLDKQVKNTAMIESVFDVIFRDNNPLNIQTYLDNVEKYLSIIKK
ncbi:MAG: hypothetical protein K6E93_06730 [Bacteroidales bacterium]|nr:hypothetical protein [Bacteroidales bacterium]